VNLRFQSTSTMGILGGMSQAMMRWCVAVAVVGLWCGQTAAADRRGTANWDLKKLGETPKVYPATQATEPAMRALFYEGLPFQGKPTRVFAWYGLPKQYSGGKVPAIVLIHGGGGTSNVRWVRLWTERGYAAISMDLCGKAYGKTDGQGQRHDMAGPSGWDDSFGQTDWPIEDQWTYHAVADAVLANSFLRSAPEVDAERIGVTGISWGGYLTCIVAGVDDRFKFAVPVYGCGFLDEDSVWLGRFKSMGEQNAGKWLGNWDPSVYLPNAKMPMLWVTGTVDFAYPLSKVRKSYRLATGDRYLSIQPGMKHSHPDGEVPAEIAAFADQLLRGKEPLARCVKQGIDGRTVWAVFESKIPLVRAQGVYTKDTGPWQQRKWVVEPAALDKPSGRASFEAPEGVSAVYLAVIDERKLLASSEHEEPK